VSGRLDPDDLELLAERVAELVLERLQARLVTKRKRIDVDADRARTLAAMGLRRGVPR